MSDQERENMLREAAGVIRKVAAGRGQLGGVFYFASDGRAKDCGLIANIQKKDPTGAKTAASGKKLRKAISGAKFAKGTIGFDRKIEFVIHQGTASPTLIKKAFKTSLANEPGLRMLSKAVVRMNDQAAEEASEDDVQTSEEQASLEMSPAEMQELQTLLAELEGDVESINEASSALNAAFLSAESVLAENQALMSESLQAAQAIEARILEINQEEDPAAWDAAFQELQDTRYKLAELSYTGPEPFPAPGQPLSESDRLIMGAAVSETLLALQIQLEAMSQEVSSHPDDLPQGEVINLVSSYQGMLDGYQNQLSALSNEV